ncbi:MAG: 4Fe-4S binding protein [bacterium]|nr:4Fe-4S binding protein [bacterium]
MLLDLFKEKRCFKLVCGAGNEDEKEIEKLVALYSKAGCNFFDLCAKPEIVEAAKRGLKYAGIEKDRYICVSIGISGDPHASKAEINPELCINCCNCKATCKQNAINSEEVCEVNRKRCIGCGQCIKACPQNAISRIDCAKDINEILPPLLDMGIDCVEFHIIGDNEEEIFTKWNDINNLFKGTLCISIDRSKQGDEDLVKRVKKLLECRKPYTTIIQADGIAMSGGEDNYRKTLQAVAIAEMFESAKLPAYIMVSGGTNSKTTELAKMCEVDIQALAIGSFARKIVREYIDRDDFLENEEIFNLALEKAKALVDVSLRNLK